MVLVRRVGSSGISSRKRTFLMKLGKGLRGREVESKTFSLSQKNFFPKILPPSFQLIKIAQGRLMALMNSAIETLNNPPHPSGNKIANNLSFNLASPARLWRKRAVFSTCTHVTNFLLGNASMAVCTHGPKSMHAYPYTPPLC